MHIKKILFSFIVLFTLLPSVFVKADYIQPPRGWSEIGVLPSEIVMGGSYVVTVEKSPIKDRFEFRIFHFPDAVKLSMKPSESTTYTDTYTIFALDGNDQHVSKRIDYQASTDLSGNVTVNWTRINEISTYVVPEVGFKDFNPSAKPRPSFGWVEKTYPSTIYDYNNLNNVYYSEKVYSVLLSESSDVLYKNEYLSLDVSSYQKIKVFINEQYISSFEDYGEGATIRVLSYEQLKEKYPNESLINIKVQAFKNVTDTEFDLHEFQSTLKLNETNPEVVDPGLDDGWADEIKQPTKPDNNWDLIGWVRYLVEWIVYAFKVLIYALATLGNSIYELMGQFGGITTALSQFFSFMPSQVMALLMVAVSVGVILRVFGR